MAHLLWLFELSLNISLLKIISIAPDIHIFNSLLASGALCHLLITFANSLNPDQDQHSVGPDLDPNSLTLW